MNKLASQVLKSPAISEGPILTHYSNFAAVYKSDSQPLDIILRATTKRPAMPVPLGAIRAGVLNYHLEAVEAVSRQWFLFMR